MSSTDLSRRRDRSPLTEVLQLFFRLGLTAFGGPAAHIAMLEDEVVERRRWMPREHFLDLVGATSLIPGPNSTEMALHVGYERAGWRGLLGAGLAFLLPAVALTLLLAWIYTRFGTLPAVAPVFQGLQAAVLAVILGAVWKLGKKALGSPAAWVPALLAAASMVAGLDFLLTLFGATFIGGFWLMAVRKESGGESAALVLLRLAWNLGQRPASLIIALAAAVALMRYRVSSPWIVTGGALAGYALALIGG